MRVGSEARLPKKTIAQGLVLKRIIPQEIAFLAGALLFAIMLSLLADMTMISHFIVDEDRAHANVYSHRDHGWYALNPNLRNSLHIWGTITYFLSTDEHGFRINDNGKAVRPAKFIFLGDSFTFGINGPWDETFVGIFERQTHEGVINAGVPSYSPTAYLYQYEVALKARVLQIPHSVVVGIDISDVQDEAAIWEDGLTHPQMSPNAAKFQLPEPGSIRKFLSSHLLATRRIYRFLRYRMHQNEPDKDYAFDQIRSAFTWEAPNNIEPARGQGKYEKLGYSPLGVSGGLTRIRAKLRAISDLTKANGGDLWLLIYPWPAQLKYQSKFVDWEKFNWDLCVEIRCKGYINTFPAFRSAQKYPDWYKTFYVLDDVHFNRRGNQLIADELIGALTPAKQ
jgi:hypothetical protein